MQTLSNVAVALFVFTLCLVSFLPQEASAIPREREAFYKWSPRHVSLLVRRGQVVCYSMQKAPLYWLNYIVKEILN